MSALAIRPSDGRQFRVDRFTPKLRSRHSVGSSIGQFRLVFIERGRGSYRLGTEILAAGPGDLFVIAPGQRHDPAGLDETTNWVITFGAEALGFGSRCGDATLLIADDLFLAAFLNPKRSSAGHRCAVPLEERLRWLARLTSLEHELRSQAVGSYAAAHALLELLLIDVVRMIRPLRGAVSPQSCPVLVSVFRFIDRRFRFPIGLADVAKAVARSPSYLTELVRRETGRTVLQWIIERRMAEARRLLLESDARVKSIAQAIGYDDAGHFIRLFNRLHGRTPQQWRLARRGHASADPAGEPPLPAVNPPLSESFPPAILTRASWVRSGRRDESDRDGQVRRAGRSPVGRDGRSPAAGARAPGPGPHHFGHPGGLQHSEG